MSSHAFVWYLTYGFSLFSFHFSLIELPRSRFHIKVVTTFEPKGLSSKPNKCNVDLELGIKPHPPGGVSLQFSDDESEQLDDREKLRRMRISKANRGNAPWNKGRKHSAETLRKIKERIRLVMQNPKVMSCSGAEAKYKPLRSGPNGNTKKDTKEQKVTILENVCWKEFGLLVFVWISFLALKIGTTEQGIHGRVEVRWQIRHRGARVNHPKGKTIDD
ncbi:Nuclease associated modular domain 3 [Sesbania bispinosa]|nr:Nuclease associated modular domain 3 [Sesbania bispinosa]